MSMMELLSQMRERARAKKEKKKSLPWFCIIISDKCKEPDKPCTECGVYLEHKDEIEKEMENMIIKVIPKPEHGKEAALITDKTGKYVRAVTMAGDLAEEVAKGNMYFNAIEKDGKLHITGRVSARF